MSEYWKSTPKYWCKHCKTYVRDTKLEKQNHEATPKHQGNLQRFLRDLHRDNQRETREKQRGKDEVARLKGIMGDSTASTASESGPPGRKTAITASNDGRQATAADRKRQLQQLAEMGIAVPEEARREMAIAGDWHVQSVTPIYDKNEPAHKAEEDSEDRKTDALAIGVRKRKFEGDEEKEEAGERVVKRGWGSTTRTWQSDDKGDLDALLNATITTKQKQDPKLVETLSELSSMKDNTSGTPPGAKDDDSYVAAVKREQDDATTISTENSATFLMPAAIDTKPQVDTAEASVLFKKRKSKQSRDKA